MTQSFLRRSWVAIGECLEFRINVHRLVGHPLLALAGKEFGERTAAAADCVSVGAVIKHPIVRDGNELKAAIAQKRALHSAAAGIDSHAKERDLHFSCR